MNQKLFFVLISLALVFGSHVPITYADEGISATLTLTANFCTVGDIVDLTIEVTHPVGSRLVPLDLESPWGEFEIRSLSHVTVENEANGQAHSSQTISFTLWKPGKHETLPLQLQISDPTGKISEITTQSVLLEVGSVVQDHDMALRELKEQVSLPRPPIWPLALAGGLFAWLLLAIVWWLYRAWKNKKAQFSQHAPDLRSTEQKALDELERIKELNLPTQGRFKEYYTLLGDAIRHYLEETHSIQTNEQTTEEIQQKIAHTTMPDEQKNRLFQLLQATDMVKFANMVPDLSQAREQAEQVRQFILAPQVELPVSSPTVVDEQPLIQEGDIS